MDYSQEEAQLIEEAYKELHANDGQAQHQCPHCGDIDTIATVIQTLILEFEKYEEKFTETTAKADQALALVFQVFEVPDNIKAEFERTAGMRGLTEKYGDRISEYEGKYRKSYDDAVASGEYGTPDEGEEMPPLLEQIYKILEEVKNDEDYEDLEGPMMEEIFAALDAKLKGSEEAPPTEGGPEPGESTDNEEVSPEDGAEDERQSQLAQQIRQWKSARSSAGITGPV